MYGFGDDRIPNEQTVDQLEIYIEEFITNLVARASRRCQRHGNDTLKLADILRVLEQDQKKFFRMPYIITASQDMKKRLNIVRNQMQIEHCDKETIKALNVNIN